MLCTELESRILDYQEGRLSPAIRQEVEAHIAHCAACRQLAGQLQLLDAVLSAALRVPALSADFDTRLLGRVEAVPQVLSEAQRSERRRQLQAEFEAGQAQLRPGAFSTGALLDYLTWPALGGVAAGLVCLLAERGFARAGGLVHAGSVAALLPWLAAATAVLAAALAVPFPRAHKWLGIA